jgi:hypothetical protein
MVAQSGRLTVSGALEAKAVLGRRIRPLGGGHRDDDVRPRRADTPPLAFDLAAME